MPSVTMYLCGNKRDANPMHVSQVSQCNKYYILRNGNIYFHSELVFTDKKKSNFI